jgi:hypothetical protein
MTKFTRLMENPVPDVLAMLDAFPTTEVAIFVMVDPYGKSLMVYPQGNDPWAEIQAAVVYTPTTLQEFANASEMAPNAVVIAASENALFVAAVVGLVHRHNLSVQAVRAAADEAMRRAAAKAASAFITQAIVDFHFGIDFGREIHPQASKYANEPGLGGSRDASIAEFNREAADLSGPLDALGNVPFGRDTFEK